MLCKKNRGNRIADTDASIENQRRQALERHKFDMNMFVRIKRLFLAFDGVQRKKKEIGIRIFGGIVMHLAEQMPFVCRVAGFFPQLPHGGALRDFAMINKSAGQL